MLKYILAFSLSLVLCGSINSQNFSWNDISEKENQVFKSKIESKKVFPKQYRLVNFDKDKNKGFFNDLDSKEANQIEISLPLPNGGEMVFVVSKHQVMHPDLAKKFPGIASYKGYAKEDESVQMVFDRSHKGFNFQILHPALGTIRIVPMKDNPEANMVYFKRDLYMTEDAPTFTCETHGEVHQVDSDADDFKSLMQGDHQLRTYRIAVACTGEYAQYHGGTVNDAMAAINSTITRVNQVYERDLSIKFTIIANNDDIVYTNPSTDPFTEGNASTMINQNQTNTDAVIGSSNYDIGHLFGTSGAGLAYLNVVCGSIKARAVSAIATPTGDAYDVDFVAHEIGHQFGAHHTFYNSCSGNKDSNYSMEPGSGSTIMAYAGICAPNIQNRADDYFHSISIQEIKTFSGNGGNSCAVKSDLGNDLPTVSAGSNYTIPKSTPFILEATGSDPNGDPITYCWEQMDPGGSDPMPPLSTNTNGPLFRSLHPTTDNKRYFPKLSDVVIGYDATWEELPSVARTMNFRVTLRDNKVGNGLTDEDDMSVTVSSTAGPFLVQSPNTGVTLSSGQNYTISWAVAGTNTSPVNCSNVDIELSVDGGYNYEYVLASNVTNDGSHLVTMPNLTTPLARIRVKCSNNIFYDISDANFGIGTSPFPSYCNVGFQNASCSTQDFIDDVIFGDINNVGSGCALHGANYSNFSHMSTDVVQGNTYPITVKPCPSYPEYFAAYIDWNVDGDFADAGEYYNIGLVAAGTSFTSNITVPNGTTNGIKKMRVVCRWNNNPLTQSDACATGIDYGEFEEYFVNVVTPCTQNLTIGTTYSSGTHHIKVSNIISASNTVMGTANVKYTAGNQVALNTGFEAALGSTFEAEIGPCN